MSDESELPRPWDGLAFVLGGSPSAAVLSPQACALLLPALSYYLGRESIVPVSGPGRHLRDVLTVVAAQAQRGHEDVPATFDPAQSVAWISTGQAAERLGLSRRHCTRLAVSGELGRARLHRHRWVIHPDDFAAFLADRHHRSSP